MPNYQAAARRAALKYGIDPAIFIAQLTQESGLKPGETSPAGAQGIAQFIPSTAAAYGVNLHDGLVTDDLEGAAKYMRDNLKATGGNYHQALSIYNSGKADGYKSIPETINYVKTILGNAGKYRGSGAGSTGSKSSGGLSQALGTGSSSVQTDLSSTPSSSGIADLLSSLQQPVRTPQYSSSALQAPSFSSEKYATGNQAVPVSSGAPVQQKPDVGSLVSMITSQAPTTTATTTASSTVKSADQVTRAGSTSNQIANLVERASSIDQQQLPYSWGGGHSGKVTNYKKTTPLDCSGAVSAVLGIDPRVSGDFERWGSAGPSPSGKGVTVYANGEHVLMSINGHFFGTSHSNPGGGAGWIPKSAIPAGYLKNFTARHLASVESR